MLLITRIESEKIKGVPLDWEAKEIEFPTFIPFGIYIDGWDTKLRNRRLQQCYKHVRPSDMTR